MKNNVLITAALIGGFLSSAGCVMDGEDSDMEYEDDDISLPEEEEESPDPASAEGTGDVDIASASEGDFLMVAEPDKREATTGERWLASTKCFALASDLAYTPRTASPGPINCAGGLPSTYMPEYSTDVMRVWLLGDRATSQFLVVAFKGTNPKDAGDLGRDFENILQSRFVSQLTPKTKFPFHVGRGWYQRWKNQARKLKPALDEVVARHARDSSQRIKIAVTGHSMGAAIATIAGYDIARYLRAKQIERRTVSIHAFNPPKSGDSSFLKNYSGALLNSGANQLYLRQYTRDGDFVNYFGRGHHPLWNKVLGSKKIGAGPYKDRELRHCAQYFGPKVGGLGRRHSMEAWYKPIGSQRPDLDTMPVAHRNCMASGS